MKLLNYSITESALVSLFIGGSLLLITSISNGQRAEDIIFTPEKVKTIPGHGMSKAEYPYDESGKYRTEWVNPSAKSPVKSSTTVKNPIPVDSEEHSNYAARIKQKAETRLAKMEEWKVKPFVGGLNYQNQFYQSCVEPKWSSCASPMRQL